MHSILHSLVFVQHIYKNIKTDAHMLDNALLLRQCEEMKAKIEQEFPAHFYYKKFFETFINAMEEIQEKYPGETAVQEFRRRYYS